VLTLEGLTARYGDRVALDAIDLAVPAGQIVSLLGPSGSGKTTLLRVVAGLERPAAGRVTFEGRDLAQVPVHERGFGLMFQDYALFPHKDVAGNVGFGLRMAGWPAERVRARVGEVLSLVGLPGAEGRSVARLSGGEQQRVALARALAPSPRLLMLDEPMGSLDRALRERLPDELRRIFETLDLTVLYVTHDQDEALRVADRTIVLRAGRVEADGTPEALWSRPPTRFTAEFLGFGNVIEGELAGGGPDGAVARTAWGLLPVGEGAPADGPVALVLRPDAVRLARDGEPATIRGTVTARRFRGDHMLLTVSVADGTPPLEVEARGGASPAVGERVAVTVDPAGVVPVRE
jgi:thiamine transport system ATP-binding protein